MAVPATSRMTAAAATTATTAPSAPTGTSKPPPSLHDAPPQLADALPRSQGGSSPPRGTTLATLARAAVPMMLAQVAGAMPTDPPSIKDGSSGGVVPAAGNGSAIDTGGHAPSKVGPVVGAAVAVAAVTAAVLVGLRLSDRRAARAEAAVAQADAGGIELGHVGPVPGAPAPAHIADAPPAYDSIARPA